MATVIFVSTVGLRMYIRVSLLLARRVAFLVVYSRKQIIIRISAPDP